jgi:protein TonB
LALGASLANANAPAQASPGPNDKETLDYPIERPGPDYPDAAADAGIEGFVLLAVVVAPDGVVVDVKVLKAEPPGWGFEEAAVEAVKKWRYKPPGHEVHFQIRVEFTLQPEPPPQ